MAGSATQTQQFKVVGTRPIRHDGIDKVVGRAKYGADYSAPEMLHGKVLRSPFAHARIKSINAERALRLPGVKAVITHQDFAALSDEVEFQYGGESPSYPYFYALNVLANARSCWAWMRAPSRLFGRDWGRVRGQAVRFSGAARAAPFQEDRPSGQDGDEPDRGFARHRSHLGLAHPGQDGRYQGRHYHGGRGLDGVRGGSFSGLTGCRRLHDRTVSYNIADFQVDGYDVLVNKPKVQAYRHPAPAMPLMGWSRWWMNWRANAASTRSTSGSRTRSKRARLRWLVRPSSASATWKCARRSKTATITSPG